jgi:DNA repair protein RecN (Recombination protein N)
MLVELHVAQLGVIEDLTVDLGPGMTVLTGETGAGKTIIVDAIALLVGARVDASVVRPGAAEAVVEGRFVAAAGGADRETVLTRVIPGSGRSRAYLDGRMAGIPQIGEVGGRLVDLHGQHAQQSLLHPAAQRAALDAAAGISLAELARAARRVRDLTSLQTGMGGDMRTRARELDLLRFQLGELDRARLESPTEDDELQDEEERLAGAASLRAAAAWIADGLGTDDGIIDRVGSLSATLSSLAPLAPLRDRLLGVQAELADVAGDARDAAEAFEDDPQRLAEVGERRRVLSELRRKYGDTLADVMAYRDQSRARILELEGLDQRAAGLEGDLGAARAELEAAEDRVGAARRAAAGGFGAAVEAILQRLAMPRARFEVRVGADRAGSDVAWLLGANPGEPVLPLAKVASGGELARAMLAARLVVTERQPDNGAAAAGEEVDDPRTLIFDEVDAGIGGEAAVAVGHALAALGRRHQVIVVTHLPQVAAFGDRHLVVRKQAAGDRTVAFVEEVDGASRVVELSRMLSGRPNSVTARRHAEELLAQRSLSPSGPG